jgi:PIN domain nuclease of toxin-antitoxin system
MKILLDTHIFIWWDSFPEKLPPKIREYMENPEHDLYISLASIWEMQIKQQLGKLTLSKNLPLLIQEQQDENQIMSLNIKMEHIFALQNLPFHHRDPFDRLLIAQAITENYAIASVDKTFKQYSVNLLP